MISAVSLTPLKSEKNFIRTSTTESFLPNFSGVNYTAKKDFCGVNDTAEKISQVSMTQMKLK
jgi:hypothetical protein